MCKKTRVCFNPLTTNITKLSNTLKQFVGKLTTNYLNVFDHFVRLALQVLRRLLWLIIKKMRVKMKNRSHKYDINKIRSRHGYEYGPVQKRMTFLYFLHLLLKMSYFVKYCSYHQEKILHVKNRLNFYLEKKKQVSWVIMWFCRNIFIAWKNVVNFCMPNFYLFFRKAIAKDVVKQTIWFLARWFYRFDIWTCCEKLWPNVIFVGISAVFHSFLFFLTLTSFVAMDFQKFWSFFQVVGLSSFGDHKFLRKKKEKCVIMWLTIEKLSRFIMKCSKGHSRKNKHYFILFLHLY